MTSAVKALRSGAYDYLQKPPNIEELAAIIARVTEHRVLLRENYEFKHRFEEKLIKATEETVTKLHNLQKAYAEVVGIGEIGIFSDKMRNILDIAKRIHDDRTIPVLIEGETGTGKEIIARIVHYRTEVNTMPFVTINCSAISHNLFESELFGYEGGAFSDAKKTGMMGKLEFSNGGTIFLDEIGDLPLDLQPKILRAIQESEIYRIGGLSKIKLDIRIVCATNKDLKSLVSKGLFRQDLYYRLNLGRIILPPLRERKKEIIPLAQMFLARFAAQKKRRFRFIHTGAASILEHHHWPGNVRELENAIERVVLLYDSVEVTPDHLKFLISENENTIVETGDDLDRITISLPPHSYSLKKGESEIIRKVLEMFQGNKTHTAQYLGVSLSTLQRKINISSPDV